MTVREAYELMTANPVNIPVNKAILENTTPTATQPGMLVGLAGSVGHYLTGTILVANSDESQVVMDVGAGQVYAHRVRNVRTYNAGAEDTFGVLHEGDVVYYDGSATMPADVFLSTSPLDSAGVANTIFGRIVYPNGVETTQAAALPTTTATAATELVGVCQVGAGGN